MFIAHAPTSYILTKWLLKRRVSAFRFGSQRVLLLVGICAGVLPDLDLVYFYTIDNRQHLHHGYLTHIPLFWLVLMGSLALVGLALRSSNVVAVSMLTALNVGGHLVADTVTGKIRWLYPLSAQDFVWVNVPATHSWWVWNFLLHWTFALEVALIAMALAVWLRSRHASADVGRSMNV